MKLDLQSLIIIKSKLLIKDLSKFEITLKLVAGHQAVYMRSLDPAQYSDRIFNFTCQEFINP